MKALIKDRHIATVREVESTDKQSFVNFYNDGQPDRVYTPMADFLAWKKIQVKSEAFEYALPAKHWTHSYRTLAGQYFSEDDLAPYKKSVSGILLFDVDFLIQVYDEAMQLSWNRAMGLLP
jgi:hypothetical protein